MVNNRVDSYSFRQRAAMPTIANDSAYCPTCSKSYKNPAAYQAHLKRPKHLLGAKSSKQHSIYADDTDTEPATPPVAAANPPSHNSQSEQIYCRPCKLSVSYRNIGRHLTSSFHSYNQQFHSRLANQMALKFIREIVQWSPFQCAACKLFFNHERHFRAHWLANPQRHRRLDREPGRFWLCHNNYCTFYCRTAGRMQQHFDSELHRNFVSAVSGRVPVIVQNFKAFRCRVCGRQFRLAKSLKEHEKSTNHSKSAGDVSRAPKPPKPHQCDTCSQKFDSIEAFEAHKKLSECTSYELFNGRVLVELQCDICKQLILRKSSVIRSHYCGHFALISCTGCVQLLRNDKDPKLFMAHLRTSHESSVSFKCTICMCTFDKLSSYTNHCNSNKKCDIQSTNGCRTVTRKISSSRQKPPPPPTTKNLQTKNTSGNNGSTSAASQQYQCSQCNFVTEWEVSLKRHVSLHSRYQCKLCAEFRAAKISQLIEHYIETHTLDDKLFKCPLCENRFSHLKNLRHHFFNSGTCKKRRPNSFLYQCPNECRFGTDCMGEFSKHLVSQHCDQFPDADAAQHFLKTFFIDVSQ